MTIEELKVSGKIIFEFIRGSHMYGTNTPASDIDIGGLYMVDNKEWLSMVQPSKEAKDAKGDTSYFELRRYLELAQTANPTVLESLWCPPDCVKIKKPIMDILLKERSIFITKRCFFSFSDYAFAQIKKATGQNKKVHNTDKYIDQLGVTLLKRLLEQGEITTQWMDIRFDKNFSKFIQKGVIFQPSDKTEWKEMDVYLEHENVKRMNKPSRDNYLHWASLSEFSLDKDILSEGGVMPFRPTKLDKYRIKHSDVSGVEHMAKFYRLYSNGEGLSFINNDLKCTSISMEREWQDFDGVIFFNENGYEKDRSEWASFFEWCANRNENRWKNDEGVAFDFDRKNMQHVVRLMLCSENIVKEGFPLIRFEGEKLKFLREIREGKYEYDYILKFATDKMNELESSFKKSSLPDQVNYKKINEIYVEMVSL